MSKLEIFQNGTSLHPDTMGDPVFQIGSKNEDGSYAVVVKAKLAEMQPVKSKPKAEAPKKKAPTKDAEKTKAKKKTKKKKASTKKKKKR